MIAKHIQLLLIVTLILVGCKKDEVNNVNTSVTVTTKPIVEITSNSAKSGGFVTTTGSASAEICGICWSESPSPTTNDYFTTDIIGAGEFISVMNNLNSNTTYYVRAYASIGSKSVMYGEEKSFTTLSNGGGNGQFNVSTNNVTDITGTTAKCGGVVTCNNGNVSITARGVCWSTSPNPTIANGHTTDGQGAGSFTSTLTGLSVNTTYYVKAYAKSNSDIVYGRENVFTTTNETPNQQPTVTVTLVSATPTYLELKFEPSANTSYYCFNTGPTLTSTIHYTGNKTRKFTDHNRNYFQPNTEYVFTVVAYDSNGIAGETLHPRFTTADVPYENYMRVYDNIYPLYTAELNNEPSGNSDIRFKVIYISGDPGNYVRLLHQCPWYETDNNWPAGTYTMGGGGTNLYSCRVVKNGTEWGVSDGSTFTISYSGNTHIYDLYGTDGNSNGHITAHFRGVPIYK